MRMRDRALTAFAEHGGLTNEQLAEVLGIGAAYASHITNNLHTEHEIIVADYIESSKTIRYVYALRRQ